MQASRGAKGGAAAAASVSRRDFLRGLGTSAVTAAAAGASAGAAELERARRDAPRGPGATSVTLTINGEHRTFALEPRTTLLEALRIHAGLTGPKEACDRGTCGACTVLLDGAAVYACMLLAIEAEGRAVTTVEGLARPALTPLQQAIVAEDGLQCGFCTPGFVMSLTALARTHPAPTAEQVRHACSGHLCRCGSYPRIVTAALAAARSQTA